MVKERVRDTHETEPSIKSTMKTRAEGAINACADRSSTRDQICQEQDKSDAVRPRQRHVFHPYYMEPEESRVTHGNLHLDQAWATANFEYLKQGDNGCNAYAAIIRNVAVRRV